MRRTYVQGLIAPLLLGLSPLVSANEIYQYTGRPFDGLYSSGPTNEFSSNSFISLQLTTSSTLVPNATYGGNAFLTWAASDGLHLLRSGDGRSLMQLSQISIDAFGKVASWLFVFERQTDVVHPTVIISMNSNPDMASVGHPARFAGEVVQVFPYPAFTSLYEGNSDTLGSWSVSTVPEMATYQFSLVGLGLLLAYRKLMKVRRGDISEA